MKKITLISVLVVLCQLGSAQQYKKQLKIGDDIPDELWQLPIKSVNSLQNDTTIHLGSYKGKLIILDFWATWCAPCIRGFPKLAAFKQQFNEDIAIVLATYEDKDAIKRFFKQRPSLKFNSGIEDSSLIQFFPHNTVPHCIIIDPQGRIASITTSDDITDTGLKLIFQNQDPDFQTKLDDLSFDFRKPLLFNRNSVKIEDLIYSSTLTGFIDGVGGGSARTNMKDTEAGFKVINQTIPHLYLHALNKPHHYYKSRLLLEGVREPERLVITGKTRKDTVNWDRQNLYCYEIVAPGYSNAEQLQIMYNELEVAFRKSPGIKGEIAIREADCMVLSLADGGKNLKTDGRHSKSTVTYNSLQRTTSFRNCLVDDLIPRLEQIVELPIIDETGFGGRFDLLLSLEVVDQYRSVKKLAILNEFLHTYGLQLKPAVRPTEMLVISGAAN